MAPFHAGDAGVSAGLAGIWGGWGGTAHRGPKNRSKPRHHGPSSNARRAPHCCHSSSKRPARGALRPRWLRRRKDGRNSPPPPLAGPASAPRRGRHWSLVPRKRTTCPLRQSGTNALVSRERRRRSPLLSLYPPPRSLAPIPQASRCAAQLPPRQPPPETVERAVVGALHEESESFLRPAPAGAAVAWQGIRSNRG